MAFLKVEIENEEHRKLAKNGFGTTSEEQKRNSKQKSSTGEDDVPTAAGLFSGSASKPLCLFCDRGHASEKCFKAQKMSLDEKTAIVKSKGACFGCLNCGHIARNCKSKAPLKCSGCGMKHQFMFCPGLPSKKSADEVVEKTGGEAV